MSRPERRPTLDAAAIQALAHPVRMDVLGYLMSAGPATASACARAVGDSPSNCSYHLRVLARHGLVEPEPSADARERPWRATITGYDIDPEDAAPAKALAEASLELDHQLAREHVRTRAALPERWRHTDAHASYGLRISPEELRALLEGVDALIRPYIAATRTDVPAGAGHVHLSLTAFPRHWDAT